ncbi:MAG: hypothetical protein ACI8QZ_002009 [Chlamydiales bacterium]|jgi:hypothetical protein
MTYVVALIVIVAVSGIIVRAGGLALYKTGLSMDSAMFQSQSAFMGVGFTTAESESVVSHPVRRRIIRILMLLGFVAVTSTLGTLVSSFAQPSASTVEPLTKVGALALGIVVIWLTFRTRAFERVLNTIITTALEHTSELHIVDYEEVLKLNKGYAVAQVTIDQGSWLAERSLRQMELAAEGLLVLSILRSNGSTLATPSSSARLEVGDRIMCYGRSDVLSNIGARTDDAHGERAHDLAVRKQRLVQVEERAEDRLEQLEESSDDQDFASAP